MLASCKLVTAQVFVVDGTLETMSNATLDLHDPIICGPNWLGHGDGLNFGHDREKERHHNFGDNHTRTLRFKALFKAECEYDLGTNNVNQFDWNKLMAISLVFPNVKETSVKLGWRWSIPKHKMELGLYSHINHSNSYNGREFLYLTDVDLDTEFNCELILSGIGLGVIVNDVGTFIKRDSIYDEGTVKTSFMKSAFFGGQECPPHDMDIEVSSIRGDLITNWHDGACEKTFSRSRFYSTDNFTINAARKITFNEEVIGQSRFVTIASGAHITCNAGDIVELKPGFHAAAGSYFKAKTSGLSCAAFVSRYANDISDTIIDNSSNNATNINAVKGTNGALTLKPTLESIKNTYFRVFPNPAKHSFTLISPDEAISNVTISDMLGKVLFETKYSTSENNIDVSNLPNGIYFIKAKTINEVFITKLVKE